jgi:hypothetical protein
MLVTVAIGERGGTAADLRRAGRRRAVARACALAVGPAAALTGVLLAVAARGTPGYTADRYLSELGVDPAPRAELYRLAVLAAALTVALLGAACAAGLGTPAAPGTSAAPRSGAGPGSGAGSGPWRLPGWLGSLPTVAGAPVAAAALGASAVFFLGSAGVTCSPGCPLPPHDAPALRDLVHAGCSAAALGLAGLGALALAGHPDRVLAACSRVAGWLVLALVAATGAMLLVQSHGLVNGLLERAVVVVALGWALAVSGLAAVRPGPARGG